MKEFIKYLGEYLRTYPQIRFNRNDEILIRDESMKYLGLTNLNQLRDRFEGQAFFDKTLMNIGGLMSIQKYLKLPLIDITKADLGGFQPKIIIDGKVIDVLVFEFGTLPLIDINKIKNPVFFVIQKDRITFNLCGFTDIKVIKDNLINTTIEKSSQANSMAFIGFKNLSKAEDLIKNKL
ncbi:hypothetical protein [Tenacibaculum sp. 190524A05c]|uniref:hypothetical protein n=1 Tax=Tenacibaculum platacis TaxID=3137852 RepID=UPI0031FB12F5